MVDYKYNLKLLLTIATVSALLIGVYVGHHADFFGPHHVERTRAAYAKDTDDIPPLLLRTSQCKTLLQTRSYWHENYTPGIVYYRPLSLTWFWIQYQIFGANDFTGWISISIVLHLIFCIVLGIFVFNLTQSYCASLCTLIVFAGARSLLPIAGIMQLFSLAVDPPAMIAVISWKDQPTIIADTLTLLSLIFVRQEKWLWGLLAALTSILFKESGWIAYPLAFSLLISTGRLKYIPIWVYAAAAVVIAIPLAARYTAGMGLFVQHPATHYGPAFYRYCDCTCGLYLSGLLDQRWPATILGTGLCLLLFRPGLSLTVRTAAVLVLAAIAGGLNSYLLGASYIVGLEQLLDPTLELRYVAYCICFCFGLGQLIKDPLLLKAFGVLVMLSMIAAIPFVVVHQPNDHALHLCYAFQDASVGAIWAAFFRYIASTIDGYLTQRPVSLKAPLEGAA